ncbi:hypothetical protein Taro_005759 [Colocasia esculenta]|uniref:BED-type domain-containing protein n=1 Tax=Colocasia esculenta TaxID=4460 RepID=A0A843TLT6_COLES|nr:hypothetical protein [Colocasia esculenta]
MLGSRHNFKCNYCSFTGQGGGVSRLKKHLAGGRLAGYHDMQGCKMVPSEVKKLMIEHLKHVRAETARKRADKEIQERIISGRERDEDIEDEVEMYAEYVPDPDVQERRARAQSRAEAWEGGQRVAHRVSFQGAQLEVGSGSGSGSAVGGADGTQSRRFSNVGDYFTRPPPTQTQLPEQGRHNKRRTCVQIEDVDPYVYPREHGKQTRIEDAYNQQGPKYKVERGEYELDEEAVDPEDPPRPNTFLARAVAEATSEEEGDRGNVGQPYSPRYEMDPEAEVDLLGDIELEHVERTIGGHGDDDDDHFERLMEGLPRTQSRRRGSSIQDAPPSQSTRAPTSSQLAKGKQIAQESRRKKTGATESRPTKEFVVLLQMLEVTVVVTVEVEVMTVVREEEMVTVVREEEVVG